MKEEFKVIEILRMPLTLFVVMVHLDILNPMPLCESHACLFSTDGFWAFVVSFFSHVVSHIAVPCFFIISGYLFYVHLCDWNWRVWLNKMKRRLWTLLIPYLLWNIMPFLYIFFLKLAAFVLEGKPLTSMITYVDSKGWHIFGDLYPSHADEVNWLGFSRGWISPYNPPMWYLQCLIIVCLITPLIWWFLKNTRVWGVVFLAILFLLKAFPLEQGIRALFFFSVGAWVSICEIEVRESLLMSMKWIIPVTIIAACADTYYDGQYTDIGYYFTHPAYVLLGVLSAFSIGFWCVRKGYVGMMKYTKYSFFIYAAHAANVIQPIRGFLLHHIYGTSLGRMLLYYLLTYGLTLFICIVIYKVLDRICPRMLMVLTGNRAKAYKNYASTSDKR